MPPNQEPDNELDPDAAGVSACMISFRGVTVPAWVRTGIREGCISAVCLFAYNIVNPVQLRSLTAALHEAAADGGQPPPLIGLDQEGGQLMAVMDGTHLPGNMALGAARSRALAANCGRVLGTELLALGCNLNFAPVLDLAQRLDSNVVGLRAFSDDPTLTADLGAVLIDGMQRAGVLATAKHFPGHGATAADSHHGTPTVTRSLLQLEQQELVPFRAAIAAGVAAIMTAHVRFPVLDDLPATLSRPILEGLLRGELGFEGLIITDAMDMAGVAAWAPFERASMALRAGADLVMLGHLPDQDDLSRRLRHDPGSPAALRIAAARASLPIAWPALSVLGCEEHRAVARRASEAAVTVLAGADALPWRPAPEDEIVLIVVDAGDLTPAETASRAPVLLGEQLASRHARLRVASLPFQADQEKVLDVLEYAAGAARVVVGTVNASEDPAQVRLVLELARRGQDPIVVALRSPLDVEVMPFVKLMVCAYGRHEHQTEAVVRALLGEIPAVGTTPFIRPAAGTPAAS